MQSHTFFLILFYSLSFSSKGTHPLFLHLWTLCINDIPLVVLGFVIHPPAILDGCTSMKDCARKVNTKARKIIFMQVRNKTLITVNKFFSYLNLNNTEYAHFTLGSACLVPELSAMSAIWQLSKSTLPLYPSFPPIASCKITTTKLITKMHKPCIYLPSYSIPAGDQTKRNVVLVNGL